MISIQEPFPDYAWPLAFEWAESRRIQLADDFFPATIDAFVESSLSKYSRTFGLWKNEILSGAVAVEWASPVVMTAHIVLSKRLWGVPAEELRQVTALLFDTEASLIRIQAFVPAWNRLAIALALRLGGRVEGTLRSATMRGGKPADAVLVAITREDFFTSVEAPDLSPETTWEQGKQVVDGPELRIVAGRDQRSDIVVDERDVLAQSDGSPEPGGGTAVAGSGSGERGNVDAGSDSGRDGGGRPDQQDIERAERPGKQLPRGKGVRVKRVDGKSSAAGRTVKRKPDRK